MKDRRLAAGLIRRLLATPLEPRRGLRVRVFVVLVALAALARCAQPPG